MIRKEVSNIHYFDVMHIYQIYKEEYDEYSLR